MKIFKNKWVLLSVGALVMVYLYRRFASPSASVTPLPFAGKNLIAPDKLLGGSYGSLEAVEPPKLMVFS